MNDVPVQCAHSRINQADPWEKYRVKKEEIVADQFSFDVVSEVNMQELKNALDQEGQPPYSFGTILQLNPKRPPAPRGLPKTTGTRMSLRLNS